MKLIILLVLVITGVSEARIIMRSDDEMPPWIMAPPQRDGWQVLVGIGSSRLSMPAAKSQAISSALTELLMNKGATLVGDVSTFQKESNGIITGEVSSRLAQSFDTTKISGLTGLAEYWENHGDRSGPDFRYWVLLALPVSESAFFSDPHLLPAVETVLKSSVIPGWGQREQGRPRMAGRMFVAAGVTLAVGSVCYLLSDHYNRQAQKTRDVTSRQDYNSWSDISNVAANISFVSFGLVYTFNVFDAYKHRNRLVR